MTLKVPLFSVALLHRAFDRPWCSVPTCLSLHNWGWLLLLCLHEDIAMITSSARVITFNNWRRIWWSKVIIALHYPFQILYKSITLIHMKTPSRTMYKLHANLLSLNLHVFKAFVVFKVEDTRCSLQWMNTHPLDSHPLTDWLKLDPLIGTTHFKGRVAAVDVIA